MILRCFFLSPLCCNCAPFEAHPPPTLQCRKIISIYDLPYAWDVSRFGQTIDGCIYRSHEVASPRGYTLLTLCLPIQSFQLWNVVLSMIIFIDN